MKKCMKYIMITSMLGCASYGTYMYMKNNKKMMKEIKKMYDFE